MKRAQRIGLALGFGTSLVLASLAPEQGDNVGAVKGCPAINYEYTPENTTTRATGLVNNLGAFTLGVLDCKCRDGEVTPTRNNNHVTYRWARTVGGTSLSDLSTYHMEVTATADVTGVVEPNSITFFSISEKSGRKDDPVASVEAEDVGTGWLISAVQPDGVSCTGNTGGSMAEKQTSDITNLGLGIIERALLAPSGHQDN